MGGLVSCWRQLTSSTRAGRHVGAGRDTLAGGKAGQRTGRSEHILPLIASSFSVTQYMRLPIHCDEGIGHLKTLDAKDTDTWDNKREPNRQFSGQRGEPRAGWRPGICKAPSPGIQASKQTLVSCGLPRIFCHSISKEI